MLRGGGEALVKGLVSIGRFGQLAGLTIKTLRHYDAVGLLRPVQVDDATGYRYYRPAQVHRAMIIKTLRALEMPLEDIAVVLDVWSDAESVRAHLKRQRQRLETNLELAERRLTFIDRLLDEGDAMPYEVTTKELDAIPAVMARTVVPIDELGRFDGGRGEEAIFAQVATHLVAEGVAFGTPAVCVIHGWTDDTRDASYGFAVTSPTSSKGLFEYEVLDGGRFLSIVHVGAPEGLHVAFAAMEEAIEERGMDVTPGWRLLMHDDMLVTPEQDLRWELVAPIR